MLKSDVVFALIPVRIGFNSILFKIIYFSDEKLIGCQIIILKNGFLKPSWVSS